MIDTKYKTNTFENENQFQAKAIILISQMFPQLRGKVWHTKNEGEFVRKAIQEGSGWRVETDAELELRKKVEGGRNKALGMVAGIPDILILYRGLLYGIELKQPSGVLSPSQKELHVNWNKDSVPVVTCYELFSVLSYISDIVNYGCSNKSDAISNMFDWFKNQRSVVY